MLIKRCKHPGMNRVWPKSPAGHVLEQVQTAVALLNLCLPDGVGTPPPCDRAAPEFDFYLVEELGH